MCIPSFIDSIPSIVFNSEVFFEHLSSVRIVGYIFFFIFPVNSFICLIFHFSFSYYKVQIRRSQFFFSLAHTQWPFLFYSISFFSFIYCYCYGGDIFSRFLSLLCILRYIFLVDYATPNRKSKMEIK